MTEDLTAAFDDRVQRILQSIMLRRHPISAMARASSQLPLSKGGLGLQSAEATAPAAYLGGVAFAMAHAPQRFKSGEALGDDSKTAILKALDALKAKGVDAILVPPPNLKGGSGARHGSSAELHAMQQPDGCDDKRPPNMRCSTGTKFVEYYGAFQPHVVSRMHVQRAITMEAHFQRINRISEYVDTDVHRDVTALTLATAAAKARLLSASDKTARLWLRPLALGRQAELSATAYARAVRQRLGLTPFDCDVICACGKLLGDDDRTHIHVQSCSSLSKHVTDARHNSIRDALARVAMAAGMDTISEYSSGLAASAKSGAQLHGVQQSEDEVGDGGADGEDEDDGERSPQAVSGSGLRPDLKIYGNNVEYLTDVCITTPSVASLCVNSAKVPKCAARLYERRKERKYKNLAFNEGVRFVPFVVEAYGAFGNKAEELIGLFEAHRMSQEHDFGLAPAAFFKGWAMATMAAAVQRAHSVLVDAAHQRVRRVHAAAAAAAQRRA